MVGQTGIEPASSGFSDQRSDLVSYCPLWRGQVPQLHIHSFYLDGLKCICYKQAHGASNGNRTRISSLEGWRSTIELYLHIVIWFIAMQRDTRKLLHPIVFYYAPSCFYIIINFLRTTHLGKTKLVFI